MTSDQILRAAKNNTWTNMNHVIENSGLELELIENLPFLKMWAVKNSKEFSHITNTMKYCGEDVSKVTFGWL